MLRTICHGHCMNFLMAIAKSISNDVPFFLSPMLFYSFKQRTQRLRNDDKAFWWITCWLIARITINVKINIIGAHTHTHTLCLWLSVSFSPNCFSSQLSSGILFLFTMRIHPLAFVPPKIQSKTFDHVFTLLPQLKAFVISICFIYWFFCGHSSNCEGKKVTFVQQWIRYVPNIRRIAQKK